MKCKKCKKEIIIDSKFCNNCGSQIILNYSAKNIFEVYAYISNSAANINNNKHLSDYHKKYLYEMYNKADKVNFIMKSFNIVGYNVRLAEEYFGELNAVELPHEAVNIFKSALTKYEKIKKLVEYFDMNTTTIGISKDFSKNYAIIDWEESYGFLGFSIEDFIKDVKKRFDDINKLPDDMFKEFAYRNASIGYIFRVFEKILAKQQIKQN